jgi:excisionase family DNA binding protein
VETSSTITAGLLDLTEAANYLGISNRALRDLCKRRAVTYAKIDYRNWRFRVRDLEAYLERIRIKAKAVYA